MSRFFTLVLFLLHINLIFSQQLYFNDASAGLMRYSSFSNSIDYILFDGIFFPDGIVVDEANGTFIFTDWTQRRIVRANFDGKILGDIAVDAENPHGITLDPENDMVYWVEFVPDLVRRAKTNGTMVETIITDIANPDDITIDPANGKLYIGGKVDGIYVADLDGSNLELIYETTGITGIDFDKTNNQLYFTRSSSKEINRIDPLGENPETLVTLSNGRPDGIQVDPLNGKIFWADNDLDGIGKCNLDGTQVEYVLEELGSGVSDVYLDASGQMYWVEYNNELIRKADTSGLNIQNLIDGNLWDQIRDVAISELDRNVFVVEGQNGIYRTNLDGENRQRIIENTPGAFGLVYDIYGRDLYWSDQAEDKIYRSDQDGNNIEVVFEGVNTRSFDIDFLTKTMYMVEFNTQEILYADLDTRVLQSLNLPFSAEPGQLAIQFQDRFLFWTDENQEVIYRTNLDTKQSELFIDQNISNLAGIEASENLSQIIYVDDNRILWANDEGQTGFEVPYPGTPFIDRVKNSEPFFFIDISLTVEQKEDLRCGGAASEVLIDAYGALAPITYRWSDGYTSTEETRLNVLPGAYTVTITDFTQRTASLSFNIDGVRPILNGEVTVTNATSEAPGAATFNIFGGTPPYEFTLFQDGMEIPDPLDQLEPGDYLMFVVDQNGCSISIPFQIDLISSNLEVDGSFIRVFPTLVRDQLYLTSTDPIPNSINYQISNFMGQFIQAAKLDEPTIDVQSLSPGGYILKLEAEGAIGIYRFVKQ